MADMFISSIKFHSNLKKRLGVAFATLVLLTSFGLLAPSAFAFSAPDRVGKADIGFDLSGAISSDSDINSTFYVGGNMSYGINEWFAVGVSLGREEFSANDITVGSATIPGPDIAGHPLFLDFIFRKYMPDKAYVPYGVLGAGIIWWKSQDVTASNGIQYEASVDPALGFKLGGGVDWFMNDKWALNLNFDYVLTTSSAPLSNGSISVRDDVNLDYWNLGGGIKYLF